MKSPYAIDLGIGFTKRAYRKHVNSTTTIKSEASTLAPVFTQDESENLTKVSFMDVDFAYYMGEEAHQSEASFLPPFEEDIEQYYESDRFKQQLFGCIAKDYQENIVLPLVVTGLPLSCFGKQHEQLQKIIKKETSVQLDGKFITITVENVLLLPQPIALYAYFIEESIIQERERVLIIDGGFRTLEITDMKQQLILNRYETELGCRKPLKKIENILREHVGESPTLHLHNLPDILYKGYICQEEIHCLQTSPISTLIQKELNAHFQEILDVVQEQFPFHQYDKIIWTGGVVDMHKKRIQEKQGAYPSIHILESAKEAALHGYYILGCRVFEDIVQQPV